MAPVYNTIPQADDEPLVQTKAAPTSIKKLIFTAAAASFVLGACAATVVAPKSAIGTYQFAAGSNGGCPPAGSTTEEDCKAAGCTWAPGVYPADVSTTGGVCVPTPGALQKCGPQHQCSADGCTCYSGNAPCSQAGLTCPVISCPNGSCDQTNAVATSGDITCSNLCGNQPVRRVQQFFTKSFLGNDAAVLARSSGEEPTPPRHRAGAASMAWRSTRRFSTNAP